MFARGSAAAPGMVMPCHRAPILGEVEAAAVEGLGGRAPRRSPLFNSGEAMGRAADWSVRVCKLPDWSGGVWTPATLRGKTAVQTGGYCERGTFQNGGKWQAVAILGHATAARPESRGRGG